MNHPIDLDRFMQDVTRRSFLTRGALGIGSAALATLMASSARAARSLNGAEIAAASAKTASPTGRWMGAVNPPNFPIRAKRVIHLCMAGGASQIESFDYKPKLNELNGKPFPDSLTKGQQLAQLQGAKLIARGSFTKFKRYGKSGLQISELFPHIGGIADDICIINSMMTEQINHDPAQAFMNSGSRRKGYPSMGSWLYYGLGADTQSLPGFVVLMSKTRAGGGLQPVSARQWGSGFLPSRFQGVQFQSQGDAVHYVGNPEGVCQSVQRLVIDGVNRLNHLDTAHHADPELQTRITQYEMAARMQASIPELTDFSNEPRHMLDLYGVAHPGDGTFASNCLLARRLAERGVRFIQLYHRGWDHHSNITRDMPIIAKETDRACAALVTDLKNRGMLDETLIMWGSEFGRTPMGQGSGRDHHINAFSMWLAGAGIKAGTTYGATDELGYRAVENPVSLHDLHATMLYLSGIEHSGFTVNFQGLDARLTGVDPASVVTGVLA